MDEIASIKKAQELQRDMFEQQVRYQLDVVKARIEMLDDERKLLLSELAQLESITNERRKFLLENQQEELSKFSQQLPL